MAYSLQETKDYLRDLASESLKYMTPFVIVDPKQISDIDGCISYPFLSIDLSTTKAGDIISYIKLIRSGEYPIILFRNIDKISSRKDRGNWEQLIIMGLKAEDGTFLFDWKDYTIRFSKLRAICTCSKYPDYLKIRGNLGWVGVDFSPF